MKQKSQLYSVLNIEKLQQLVYPKNHSRISVISDTALITSYILREDDTRYQTTNIVSRRTANIFLSGRFR